MTKDFRNIGLNRKLRSVNNLSAISGDDDLKRYIDAKVEDIVRPGGLNYTNVAALGRDIKAVVSLDRKLGNFDNIQEAINYVDSLGGGSILIKQGTYEIENTITMFSNISLIGEGIGLTILDFTNNTGLNDDGIDATGTEITKDGTISTTNGSKTISGSGTSFSTDGVSSGDILFFENVAQTVESVTSDTELDIDTTYKGVSGSSIEYTIGNPKSNMSFSSMTMKNNPNSEAVFIDYTENISFSNVSFENNDRHVVGFNLINAGFSDCLFTGSTNTSPQFGVDIGSSSSQRATSLRFTKCVFYNETDPLRVSKLIDVTISDCYFIHCDGTALVLFGERTTVNGCQFLRNNRAMNMTTSASENIINACIFDRNGTAIAQGVGADFNKISDNTFSNNSTGITIDGTQATPDRTHITGNLFLSSGDDVTIQSGADNWLVEGNYFHNGTLTNNGTTALIRSNFNVSDS